MTTLHEITLQDGTKVLVRGIPKVEGFEDVEKFKFNRPESIDTGDTEITMGEANRAALNLTLHGSTAVPKVHELKTDPHAFDAVWRGVKTHEIRYDDRGYQVGDRLLLRETTKPIREREPDEAARYTGRSITADTTHIQRGYGLSAGWCVLSIKIELLQTMEDEDDT